MKFRLKMTLCMVWLLALAYGVGSTVLIADAFSDNLRREQDAAYRGYRIAVSTLQMVNSVSPRASADEVAATLGQLAEQNSFGWSGLRLSIGDRVIYAHGALPAGGAVNASDALTAAVCTLDDDSHGIVLSGALSTGSDVMQLDISYNIDALYESRARQQAISRQIFLILVAVGGALSWFMAYVLTNPLRSLSRATRKLAGGELGYRAHCAGRDEIGTLAADFNTMAEKLQMNVDALQDAMQRQESFMGSFAHEMKTPMTSIIGYADLMRAQSLTPEEQRDAANYIFSEGKRLESLSLKLLDILVMKNTKITLSPASPAQIVSSLAEHLRPVYLKSGIDVRYKCQNGRCLLDADLVRTLLVNLMDNARKAMENGGTIMLTAQLTDAGCVFKVYDNGRGIPPQALEHLTEAFYRVDKSRSRAQGGVGLGLSLCQEIAALHGGSISFSSTEGRGTCVTVELKGGRA